MAEQELDLLPRPIPQRLRSKLTVCRFKPANLSLSSSVGRSTQAPMDRPSFLLFVRAVLPERAPEAPSGRAPEVGGQVLTKTSCSPRLHCAEWSCVVLSDSPRHHNGSGRDWPDKSATRRSAPRKLTLPRYGDLGSLPDRSPQLGWFAVMGRGGVCYYPSDTLGPVLRFRKALPARSNGGRERPGARLSKPEWRFRRGLSESLRRSPWLATGAAP